MSKLTKEEFQAYLKQIRELAEGPLEEIQKEVEVTNKFPQEFYDLAIENNLYRCSLPEEYIILLEHIKEGCYGIISETRVFKQ